MTEKKNPGGDTGATDGSLRKFDADHIGDAVQKALRTHSNLLWATPPRTVSYGRLHALRMQSAWRLTRAWLRTASSLEAALHDLPLVLPMTERKLTLPLPLLSPPFAFDELDALRMVLDAVGSEPRLGQ